VWGQQQAERGQWEPGQPGNAGSLAGGRDEPAWHGTGGEPPPPRQAGMLGAGGLILGEGQKGGSWVGGGSLLGDLWISGERTEEAKGVVRGRGREEGMGGRSRAG